MAIVVEDLTLAGPGGRPIVSRLGFTVERGRTSALLGPSGAGKTLAALALVGLLPPGVVETGGRVAIDCEPPAPPVARAAWRGRRIGFVFQDPRTALHPAFPAIDALMAALSAGGLPRAEAARRAAEWLARVGLEEAAVARRARPRELSGGELQRVLIALALARDPEYLVADEPTSHLDVLTQGKILATIVDLVRERGLGLLLVTHDPRVVASLADTIWNVPVPAGAPR